jgi:hypothetical protein
MNKLEQTKFSIFKTSLIMSVLSLLIAWSTELLIKELFYLV